MIYTVYPSALDCGMGIQDFWELSYGEIIDYMESRKREETRSLKERIVRNYELSELIGCYLFKALDSSVRIPVIYEQYPDLFAEEKKRHEQAEQKAALELYKARMTDFALQHNHKREGGAK